MAASVKTEIRPDLSSDHAMPGAMVELPAALPRRRLEAMAVAGRELLAWRQILAKTRDNVVGEVLRNESAFYVLDHYPRGDVYDPESHAQWYYHAHDKRDRPDEHGHFHTFVRGRGLPEDLGLSSEMKMKAAANDLVCHLVAISMDRSGWPRKLFTTNRWVTGETWFPAADVVRMLDRFDLQLARPSWIVNRWLSAMVVLFHPQIVDLLHARDARIEAWRASHPDTNDVHEDRRLEVTSELAVDVEAQVEAVTRRLAG